MAWDSQALDRNALPRIDLHVDRREERRRILQRSRRDLVLLGGIVTMAVAVLAPLTFETASVRCQLGRVQAEAADVEARFATMTNAAAAARGRLSRWERFHTAQIRRRAWCDLLGALAAAVPPRAYIEQVAATGKDGRTDIVIGGSAEDMGVVRSIEAALARSGALTEVRVAEAAADRAISPTGIRYKIVARASGALGSDAVAPK